MIQIIAIVAYSHDGRSRTLQLEPGKVNIVSGDSRTGKSAVLDIIDYCFGSKECNVPEGILRRNVSWYGLFLKTDNGRVFIARQVPLNDALSSDAVYYKTDIIGELPTLDQLVAVTNRDGLKLLLSSWTGISDYLHEPSPGQTRSPLVATIRHALGLCLQSQNEIAQRKHLFHGTADRDVAQALKDTLPYFLGAVSKDFMIKQQEFKDILLKIRQIERQILESSAIEGKGVSRADTLLAEARAAGLTDLSDHASFQQKLEILRAIQSSPVPDVFNEGNEESEFGRLIYEKNRLIDEERSLRVSLQRAKEFEKNSKGYSTEIYEQLSRVQALTVFETDVSKEHSCPMCLQALTEDAQSPSIKDLRKAHEYIEERSAPINFATPRIEFAIQENEDKISNLLEQREINRQNLIAIKKSNKRLQLASDTEAKRALILGRISLYVESIPDLPDQAKQNLYLKKLKEQKLQIEQTISGDMLQQRMDSCLSNVNRYLSEYAKKVELEYSDSPLRLDPKHLTIVADTLDRPVPMKDMGSGENHVGYHIVAHLALHTWFVFRKLPVPSFLILDQLSQAHFSPDADNSTSDPHKKNDADRIAVKRLYNLIFDVVESLDGKFQVIITDHPDFGDDLRFQAALREKWRDGLKLIPKEWPKLKP